jgi:hypothetical protein
MPLTDTPTQAELADAQARRAAVGHRADQIRRRRTGAIAGLVAVLVLAVAVPLAMTRSTNHSEGVVTTVPPSPTSTTSPTPSTTSEAVTSTTTPVPQGTPLTFANVRLVVPDGWVTSRYVGGCVQPAHASPTDGLAGCPGGIWLVTPDGLPSTPLQAVTSGHLAWDDGTGMDCPFGNSTGEKKMDGPEIAHGFRPVGTVTAEWEEWAATCTQGPVNHVQAWFLPQTNLLLISASSSPGITQILASVRPLSVAEDPLLAAAGTWGGRGTLLRINPDGVGVLTWRTYRQCSTTVTYPCDNPSQPISNYTAELRLTMVRSGAGGSWSAHGAIDGGSDPPTWLTYGPVQVTQINGVVTITGGGFVAGTYPNGQLCSDSVRGNGAATNGGCP